MAHLAVVAPPFLGHLNPMRALARELIRRGHRVTRIGIPEAGALAPDPAIAFEPIGAEAFGPGTLSRMNAAMARAARSPLGLPAVLRMTEDATALLLREAPDALRRIGADALLADGTEPAGPLLGRHLGLPVVAVANALPLDREPALPPPFTGWRYDRTPWGLERNRGGYRVADWLMRRQRSELTAAAEPWGLSAADQAANVTISQTVVGFDFPRLAPPPEFHAVGPLRDLAGSGGEGAFALPPDDGRPLAYGSLGTLAGGDLRLFRRIAAAAEQAGLRLVLAHGGRLTAGQVATLPGRPSVHAFVPQPFVLRRASVAILNCGLNTVMDALAAGVPVLALPLAFEQGAIAARLERCGAGFAVPRFRRTASGLAAGLRRVMGEGGFREAAGRLAAEIAEAGGVVRAADVVESALRTR